MTKKLFILALLVSTTAIATELRINSWYRLDRDSSRDTAAEVCFSVTPAPATPTLAQITVDKGTSSQAFYNAWIGPRGAVCHVVSTLRGRVYIEVPGLELETKQSL